MRDAAGNTRNVTRKDGKYAKQLLCCGCNKPAGSEPYCDGDTGDVICQRAKCVARIDRPIAERETHYAAMRAKRTVQA